MKIILFDIDGTLLLTGGVGSRAFRRAFTEAYRKEPDMSCYSPWGATDYQIARSLIEYHFSSREVGEDEVQQFLDRYLEIFEETVQADEGFHLMPMAAECVTAVAAVENHLLGVATGNLSRSGWAKLKRGGLDSWFHFGGFAEDGILRADILHAAKQRGREMAGAGDHEFWVIGDTPYDIEAARAIDAKVLAVATGKYTHDELAEHKPDVLLADLCDLAANPALLT